MIIGRRKNICDIHWENDYNEEYDAYYCPVCFMWLEPHCSCTQEDKDNEECHVPLIRPETAEGL